MVHARHLTLYHPERSARALHFLYAMSSSMIHGVGRDARHVAERIPERLAAEPAARMTSAA